MHRWPLLTKSERVTINYFLLLSIDPVINICRDTVVGGLSYVKGRLTAPVSGEEGKDEEIKESAKEKSSQAADKLSSAACSAKDKASAATEETKEQSKGLFASIKEALGGKPETAHSKDVGEKAKSTLEEAQDK